jgi:2-amino-4-hydroxy-6-hydroxymethyldihydropteridine diphosphokinase
VSNKKVSLQGADAMNNGIFLLLGSNQGNPPDRLAEAAERIEKDAGKIVARSSLYRSAAWGIEAQPDFFNQVLEIESPYDAGVLLQKLLSIERTMGRVRAEKWGPRIIDIDILFYGPQVVSSPSLTVPHPGIPGRKFTLLPLSQIAPELVHPVLGKTIATLLQECRDPLMVTVVT